VVVRNNDIVAVGGLHKTDTEDARSRIPILGDLPILGKIFGGTRSIERRSALMILLKPRIIERYEDVLHITSEKIDHRLAVGKLAKDPEDRMRKETLKLKKETETNLKKPAPKSWAFKPRDENEGENKKSNNRIQVSDPTSEYLPEYDPVPQKIDDGLIGPPPSLEAYPAPGTSDSFDGRGT
jgi:hypothetical protein